MCQLFDDELFSIESFFQSDPTLTMPSQTPLIIIFSLSLIIFLVNANDKSHSLEVLMPDAVASHVRSSAQRRKE
jgi:hypothetical protein